MTVQSPQQKPADALTDIVPKIPDLRRIAYELFPGAIEVEVESDPEIAGITLSSA